MPIRLPESTVNTFLIKSLQISKHLSQLNFVRGAISHSGSLNSSWIFPSLQALF
jgi:hypothetical protein